MRERGGPLPLYGLRDARRAAAPRQLLRRAGESSSHRSNHTTFQRQSVSAAEKYEDVSTKFTDVSAKFKGISAN